MGYESGKDFNTYVIYMYEYTHTHDIYLSPIWIAFLASNWSSVACQNIAERTLVDRHNLLIYHFLFQNMLN